MRSSRLPPPVWSVVEDLAAHDRITAAHCERVAQLAEAVAAELGLSVEERALARDAGVLHDIGKLEISSALLNKEGRLGREERLLLDRHAHSGAELLLGIDPRLHDLADVIASHHERLDGSGYPRGLRGDEITPVSRIVATADVYDALVAERPYRSRPFTRVEACGYLTANAGQLFDARCVGALLAVTSTDVFPAEADEH